MARLAPAHHLLAIALSLGANWPAIAATDPSALCEAAAFEAASAYDIPHDIMRGLTLTETGRSLNGALRPWPWAVNQAGEGHWFATQDEMLAHIRTAIDAGITNFDVGCFQLNYRWHGAEFASLEEMADPTLNARYAARHLRDKFGEKGRWDAAVAAYHSATAEHATRYLARFTEIYAGLTSPVTPPQPAPPQDAPPDAQNSFPFLVAGLSGTGGSLVPAVAGGRSLFGDSN